MAGKESVIKVQKIVNGEIKSEIRKADGEDESDRFALCS